MRQPFLSHESLRWPPMAVLEYSCTNSKCSRVRTRRAARDRETLSFLWNRGLSLSVCSWLHALCSCYATDMCPKVPVCVIRLLGDLAIIGTHMAEASFHCSWSRIYGSSHPDSLSKAKGNWVQRKSKCIHQLLKEQSEINKSWRKKAKSNVFRGEKNIADQDHVRRWDTCSCVWQKCKDSIQVWLGTVILLIWSWLQRLHHWPLFGLEMVPTV